MKKVMIDIWSDTMCPFCYIGDTVLEQALENFEHKDQVEVRYHSYQLMPELGTEPTDLDKLLGERYSPEQRAAQNQHIAARGAELGLDFNFDKAVTVNTFSAHRMSHYAASKNTESKNAGSAYMRLLFKAYFSDGKNVADPNVLADLAAEVGLDRAEAFTVANSTDYADQVTADIEQASKLGFGGVPFFIFNNTYGVSGAQPLDVFKKTLKRVWDEAA